MYSQFDLNSILLPYDSSLALRECEDISLVTDEEQLYALCCEGMTEGRMDISYVIKGGETVKEAELVKCKNGLAVNFTEDYMRRRDPASMSIADEYSSDKPRFSKRYGYDFSILRSETLRWLSAQKLILLPFKAGGSRYGYDSLLICPQNTAFFALALSMMQGKILSSPEELHFEPKCIIYLAPAFRHSHFRGKQAVVHQRSENYHEIFAYNLYPGPSAKKGVFSLLLDMGEREGWVTNHASAAVSESAYGNRLIFMHEGASGGGKSEMLERLRAGEDGRIALGRNILSGEEYSLHLKEGCHIRPIADDMVLACSEFQSDNGKLAIADGESGWFLRVDGDTAYGSIPLYERISIHPQSPLMFFNIDATPGATCLIWEHYIENNGRPCSNPRVIIPRSQLGCSEENLPEYVDVRSFGVRMPPTTAEKPDYGVMAMIQIVPTALAWLWRLVSPRGYKNPSISGNTIGLESEGVGSYWPFCTGQRTKQANLLLRQLNSSPNTLNILIPNQHVGACYLGFAGQWLVREMLTRRGGKLGAERLVPSPCPLFGYELDSLRLEGQCIPSGFLHPYMQPELGLEGYQAGAGIMCAFFKERLAEYLGSGLDAEGHRIIELCLSDAPLEEYLRLSPPLPLSGAI